MNFLSYYYFYKRERESKKKPTISAGNRLITEINELQHSTGTTASSAGAAFTSQDLLDAREMLKHKLNEVENQQIANNGGWDALELKAADLREVAKLEDGVKAVINWILSSGEKMMNDQLQVAFDLPSAHRLRFEHEMMELKCCTTYGQYAELRYKIDQFKKQGDAANDLRSQKQFMDFICRSFASRMEQRRNTLITCVRFFKLVSEYFEGTSTTFESLIMGAKVDDSKDAQSKLEKLCSSEKNLGESDL